MGVWKNGIRWDDATYFISFARKVRAASTAPIANLLAVPVLQDGVTLVANDTFFIKDGASPDGIAAVSDAYNGLWNVGTVAGGVAPLTRSFHSQLASQLSGQIIFVEMGTVNQGQAWCLPLDTASIVVNTTPLVYVPSGAGSSSPLFNNWKQSVWTTNLEGVTVANLAATDLVATFGAVDTPIEGQRVLLRCAVSRDMIEPQATAHAGIFEVGPVVLGVAPLTRTADADSSTKLPCGTTVYVEKGIFQRRYFAMDVASPFVLDTTDQAWWEQPTTTIYGTWAAFAAAFAAPSEEFRDQGYYVTDATKSSLWQCIRTAAGAWIWRPIWSDWQDTWANLPAAAAAYDGLRYYVTDAAKLSSWQCIRTGVATYQWAVIWSGWLDTYANLPVASAQYVGLRYFATDHGLWYTCISDGAGTYGWRPGSPGNLYLTWAQFALVPASSVLHGLHAYITDGLAEYRCIRTAAATYIWQLETYDARSPTDANDRLVYLLDETAGPVLDNSGAEAAGDLTAYGSPGFGRVGLFDGGLDIPGDRSGAQGASSNTYSYATPTISLWVYPRRMNEDAYVLYRAYLLAGTWVPGAINTAVSIVIKIDGGVEFSIYAGAARRTAAISAASQHALGLREWQQIVCTFDANTLRLYTRGNEAAATAYVGAIDYNTHGPWVIGSIADAGGGPAGFDGIIDRVRIANTVRSAAWVRETTQRGLGIWGGP
jgi:hypothetical protein